jgi:hypothetical protein
LKGESFEDVMMAYGIELKDKKETQQLQEELAGRICPYCKMQNLPDAQFCSQCEYTLDPEAFLKVREEAEKNKKEAEENKKKLADMTIDMEQVKTQLANTNDQVATMIEIFTKINRNEVITSGPEVKHFLERKLGVMTKGKYGLVPSSDGIEIFLEPT